MGQSAITDKIPLTTGHLWDLLINLTTISPTLALGHIGTVWAKSIGYGHNQCFNVTSDRSMHPAGCGKLSSQIHTHQTDRPSPAVIVRWIAGVNRQHKYTLTNSTALQYSQTFWANVTLRNVRLVASHLRHTPSTCQPYLFYLFIYYY